MIRKFRLVLIAVMVCFAAGGCFRRVSETRQLDETAAIVFVGAIEGAQAYIDDGAGIDLSTGGQRPRRYTVEPGTHRVRVMRGGQVVVDREIFVGDGQVFEVKVP
ncbi:MAG: hypothetical protein D6806_04005 [Deltaproteobacteria bacterium]|nr:MAG: hypothetical protein D6806_04005 [Deltaproteobacteria bacterium]